jgi:hypothetical protein
MRRPPSVEATSRPLRSRRRLCPVDRTCPSVGLCIMGELTVPAPISSPPPGLRSGMSCFNPPPTTTTGAAAGGRSAATGGDYDSSRAMVSTLSSFTLTDCSTR